MTESPSEARGRLEHSSETGTYRVTFSRDTGAPSTVVIEAMAAVTDREPDELDPLYSVVDTEALDKLCQPSVNDRHQGDVEVSFAYHEHEVSVRSYGIIEIEPTER